MSYGNPLHTPVSASQVSGYFSIGDALGSSSGKSEFIVGHRRHLPQSLYHPQSKWNQATGASNKIGNVIHIDLHGYSRQGVPMVELKNRSVNALGQMIVGANDQVLKHTKLQRITLRINWPGYAHVDWARSIEILVGDIPITRAQLAQKVVVVFANYLEVNRNQPCTVPDYKISTDRIQFAHLVLVGLHNVFEDVWQADVAIDLR